VVLPSSRNDALVALQCPPQAKVQWLPVHVGADAAGLVDKEGTACVIPDLFVVFLSARVLCGYAKAEIVSVSVSEG
jgi:hypothetical protein